MKIFWINGFGLAVHEVLPDGSGLYLRGNDGSPVEQKS